MADPSKKSLFNPARWLRRGPVVNVLRLEGVIGLRAGFTRGLAHAPLEQAVEAAFSGRRVKAVALAINSPGGAPAQSHLIAAHIRRLSEEKDIPVFAFCEDVAASGGYMLACAADTIYVDPYSVIGSIGVVSAGFGLHEAIDRLGVERRLHASGARKAMLDPFQPEDSEDLARLKAIQTRIHASFIDWVKQSRGDRLSESEPLFEGDVWIGEEAVPLGIADAVGHLRPVMRARFGEDLTFKRIPVGRKPLLSRLLGAQPAGALGAGAAQGTLDAVEDRALWGRYGM